MMLAVLASKEPEGIFFVYQKSQHRVTPQGIVKIAGSPTIARNATEKRAQKRPQKRAQYQTNRKIMPDFPLLIFDPFALHFYVFLSFWIKTEKCVIVDAINLWARIASGVLLDALLGMFLGALMGSSAGVTPGQVCLLNSLGL